MKPFFALLSLTGAMRILIVDDHADAREVLSIALRSAGHQVDEAVDGLAALEPLRAGSNPSLILLDLMVPRLDGESFVKAMRTDARGFGIPVVVISGHDEPRRKAAKLGVARCLVKPVELDELSTVIESFRRVT